MTAAALPIAGRPATRDPFMPRSAQRNGPALTLALVAHALLIAALALGVNWHRSDDSPVTAEVWSSVPQAAAPRAVEPPPSPSVDTPKPPPAVQRTPPPVPVPTPTPVLPDPQIAIEKERREDAKRRQAEADEARRRQAARDEAQRAKDALAAKQAALDKQRLERDRLAKAKAEAERVAADQARLDKLNTTKADKADAARLDALRKAQLARMMGQTGATGGPTDTGSALHSAGPSAGYAGRIRAQIKRNIHFFDTVSSNPVASVEVRVAPDGTIVGRRLLKSSGLPGFDDAVLKAIDLTAVLPRDVDGRVPPLFQIDFKPNE